MKSKSYSEIADLGNSLDDIERLQHIHRSIETESQVNLLG